MQLLWADIKTARALFRRTLRGSTLTRRERKQLLRTISDLFRLVPFSMFILIPMMEFALPFGMAQASGSSLSSIPLVVSFERINNRQTVGLP